MQSNRYLAAAFFIAVLANILFILFLFNKIDERRMTVHIDENPLSHDNNYFEQGAIKNVDYV